MKRLPARVILAIMTTATVLVWVAFSVYQELKAEHPPQVSKEILQPITPELDTQTLALIGKKLYFENGGTVAFSSQSAIINLVPEVVVTPTQTEEKVTQASESAQVTQEETATSSAEISQ